MSTPALSKRQLVSYGVGDFYGGGTFFMLGLLYLFFMTDVVGLPPQKAGLIFVVGKLWDAFLDPLIGYLSDHTRTRYGRRRVFCLGGMIPAGIAFALLWVPISNPDLQFWYYLASFVFFTTTFAALMIPYYALGAELHPDDKERTRITGVRIFFSQLSVVVGGVLPKLIIDSFPSSKQGHLMMGIVFSIAFTLPWIFVFLGTKEVAAAHVRKHQFGDFFKTFGSVFRNRAFRIHLAMYLCAYAAMDLVMATLRYFMKYSLNRENLLTPALATLLIAQILMLPVYVRLANSKGKGFTYVLGLSIWALAILPTGFLPRDVSPALLLPLCALIGVGLSAGVMIPWAILPQVGDVDELMTGEKRIGIYSGVMTFVRKLVQAMAIYGLSLALELIGYVPGVEQSENTLFFLRSLYIVAPATVLAAGIYFGWRYPITPKVHALLAAELARRRAGGHPNAMTPDTQKAYQACAGG
jgi:oligogalacturonide transporter